MPTPHDALVRFCRHGRRPGLAMTLGALAAAVQPAAAATVSEYDRMSEAARVTLVQGAVTAIAQGYGADPKITACIQAYGAPAPGGAAPRLEADFESVLARSRAVAPDEYQIERLLQAVIMVECGILPEDAE
ncbi:MAG: hypothetical protein ACFCVH_15060 [Alphaproteobacteria bacterium]